MIVLGYDLETDGLDKHNCRIIEVGLVLYSTGQRRIVESTSLLVKEAGAKITPEITDLTHITPEANDYFGYQIPEALEIVGHFFDSAEAVLGHNVNRFDKVVTANVTKRNNVALPERLWVDTMTDLPYGVKGEKLVTMCAQAPGGGFLLGDAHSAGADALGSLNLAIRWGIEDAIERAKVPNVLIRSHQERGDEANKIARKAGFIWNNAHKIWWRVVKATDIDKIRVSVPFEISEVDKAITIESVQD